MKVLACVSHLPNTDGDEVCQAIRRKKKVKRKEGCYAESSEVMSSYLENIYVVRHETTK